MRGVLGGPQCCLLRQVSHVPTSSTVRRRVLQTLDSREDGAMEKQVTVVGEDREKLIHHTGRS